MEFIYNLKINKIVFKNYLHVSTILVAKKCEKTYIVDKTTIKK